VVNDSTIVPVCFRSAVVVLFLLLGLGSSESADGQEPSQPQPTFEDLLRRLSSVPADACEYPGADFSDLELHLFEQADKAVAQRLNERSESPGPIAASAGPRVRALEALQNLERISGKIHSNWPEEKRFHFQVLDIPPALLVKMTYRNRATFSFFAVPERDAYNKPANQWQATGALDDHRSRPAGGYDSLDLFILRKGPAGNPRFMAKFIGAGCGSGVSVAYYAYDWSPREMAGPNEFIRLQGAVSRFGPDGRRKPSEKDKEYWFEPIGQLRTQGALITLPYCWFSAIDTWDNPSLCAVNSYDISADRARFIRSVSNRPDLLPIAKAIEYAQARDYPAVLAYCGSPHAARRMVRDIPPFVSGAEDLKIQRIGALKKSVEIGDREAFHFEVEKHGDRWLVVSFRTD
jgi:hypothetical protein